MYISLVDVPVAPVFDPEFAVFVTGAFLFMFFDLIVVAVRRFETFEICGRDVPVTRCRLVATFVAPPFDLERFAPPTFPDDIAVFCTFPVGASMSARMNEVLE